jgi:hypothetical protein
LGKGHESSKKAGQLEDPKKKKKAGQLEDLKDLGNMKTKLRISWDKLAAHASLLGAAANASLLGAGAGISGVTCSNAVHPTKPPVGERPFAMLMQWLEAAQHAVTAGKTQQEAFAAAAHQAVKPKRTQAAKSKRKKSRGGVEVQDQPSTEEGALFHRKIDNLLCQVSARGEITVICTECWGEDGTVAIANYKGDTTDLVKTLCGHHAGSEMAAQRGQEAGWASDAVINAMPEGRQKETAIAKKVGAGRTTDLGMDRLSEEQRAAAEEARLRRRAGEGRISDADLDGLSEEQRAAAGDAKARAGRTTVAGMDRLPVAQRAAALGNKQHRRLAAVEFRPDGDRKQEPKSSDKLLWALWELSVKNLGEQYSSMRETVDAYKRATGADTAPIAEALGQHHGALSFAELIAASLTADGRVAGPDEHIVLIAALVSNHGHRAPAGFMWPVSDKPVARVRAVQRVNLERERALFAATPFGKFDFPDLQASYLITQKDGLKRGPE